MPQEPANGRATELDHAVDRIRHIICSDHVRDWITENFYWPGFTVLLATLAYTAAHARAVHQCHMSGELVGAGGILLVVVMLASLDTRLKEWHHLAELVAAAGHTADERARAKEVSTFTSMISRQNTRINLVLLSCGIGGVVIACFHIYVEQLFEGAWLRWVSIALLLTNVCVVISVAQLCKARLLGAKQCLMTIERLVSGVSIEEISRWEYRGPAKIRVR